MLVERLYPPPLSPQHRARGLTGLFTSSRSIPPGVPLLIFRKLFDYLVIKSSTFIFLSSFLTCHLLICQPNILPIYLSVHPLTYFDIHLFTYSFICFVLASTAFWCRSVHGTKAMKHRYKWQFP